MNTEKSPLISVIVPVYKVEKYLPACLDSLLAQTYRNFELIVVNDGSPDDCWQIMQRYAAQDARVRIFNKENGGVSSARNFGLDVARGEYIGFVDSDDFVLPQYLELAVRCLVQLRHSHGYVPLPRYTGKPVPVDSDRMPGTAEDHGGKLLVDAGMERRALLADADPPGDITGYPL